MFEKYTIGRLYLCRKKITLKMKNFYIHIDKLS